MYEFLLLRFVPVWIAIVSRSNATPLVQERLRYFTLFSLREVYAAVAREVGLPAGPSRQIEDLGILPRSMPASNTCPNASR